MVSSTARERGARGRTVVIPTRGSGLIDPPAPSIGRVRSCSILSDLDNGNGEETSKLQPRVGMEVGSGAELGVEIGRRDLEKNRALHSPAQDARFEGRTAIQQVAQLPGEENPTSKWSICPSSMINARECKYLLCSMALADSREGTEGGNQPPSSF